MLEPASFDLVFTGIGALCWLPSVREWADVVAALLRPGGRLFIREGHPMLWSLSDPRDDGSSSSSSRTSRSRAGRAFVEETSYVEHEGALASPETVGFNHGLGEIINAVWDAGLTLTAFEEHGRCRGTRSATAFVEVPTPRRVPARASGRSGSPPRYTLQARKPDLAHSRDTVSMAACPITITDNVADVRMIRADKRNALDNAMFTALAEAGERLKTEPGVRAVVRQRRGIVVLRRPRLQLVLGDGRRR